MRYALLMGSVKEVEDVTIPIDSNLVKKQLNDTKNGLNEFTGTGDFKFKWKNKSNADILQTPTFGTLVDKIDEITSVKEDDIFLFYYFGHGYVNNDKLILAYRSFDVNNDDYSINFIYDKLIKKGFQKIALILDCCYAGKGFESLLANQNNYYAIGASYNTYTYLSDKGGVFSNHLLSTLKSTNLSVLKNLNKTEVTLKDVYDNTVDQIDLLHESKQPTPFCFGNIGDKIILKKVKKNIYNFPSFDSTAKINSLYNKLNFIMKEIISTNRVSKQDVYKSIIDNKHRPFLIDERNNRYVGMNKVEDYLKILLNLSFVKENNKKMELSSFGLTAIRKEGSVYNKILIKRLYHWMLDKKNNEISWSNIADYRSKTLETLTALIKDFQVPSFLNFRDRFESLHGEKINNNRDELKIILSLLSYAKEIKRLDSNSYFTY